MDEQEPAVVWKCPRCGAGHGERHGGLGRRRAFNEACLDAGGFCEGLICSCTEPGSELEDHGSEGNPCPYAECSHWGWDGCIPEKPKKPKKLKGWRKKAWAAGWRPTQESSDRD